MSAWKHPTPDRVVGAVDPDDGLLTFAAAVKHAPTIDGEPVSACALRCWSRDGLRAASGERLALATVLLAGKRYTTRQAIREFLIEVTAEPRVRSAPLQLPEHVRRGLEAHGLRIGGRLDQVG